MSCATPPLPLVLCVTMVNVIEIRRNSFILRIYRHRIYLLQKHPVFKIVFIIELNKRKWKIKNGDDQLTGFPRAINR